MERSWIPKSVATEEELHWAMLWKVANVLQGFTEPDRTDLELIAEIDELDSRGILTELQKNILFRMRTVPSTDSDEF